MGRPSIPSRRGLIVPFVLLVLFFALPALAWEPGELLIWINGDKGFRGIEEIGKLFEEATGVPVKVEHPDGATDKFVNAAQAGKGPDIMIWAHDRLGEWADNGLLMPVEPTPRFRRAVFDTAWDAFRHKGRLWGFPISMECTALIYNRALIREDEIPANLADVRSFVAPLAEKGATPILWDYNNTYFTWGVLAAGGAEIFGRGADGDYDPAVIGVAEPSVVEAAAEIRSLIADGTMASAATYSVAEALMNDGKLAMFISGPFAWENLRKSGIDFGISLVPGFHEKPGRPFVGVLGAMFNRASPNLDLAQEFLENWLVTPPGLDAMDRHVSLGVPALKAAYEARKGDPLVVGSMRNIEVGTLMPNIPQMGAFWSAMESALNTVTSGRDTPEEALGNAADRMRNAIQ